MNHYFPKVYGYGPLEFLRATTLLLLVADTGLKAAGPSQLDNWRVERLGGVNCLYYVLRYHGLPVTYLDLIDNNGRTPSDFAHLQAVCLNYSLSMTIYRLKPSDLTKVQLPAILLLDHPTIEGACNFFVLLGIGDSEYLLFNGGEAVIEKMNRDQFLRCWSGYALARPPRQERFSSSMMALLLVTLVAYGALRWRMLRKL